MALKGAPPHRALTCETSGCSHAGTGVYGATSALPPKNVVQQGVSQSLPKRADLYFTRNHRACSMIVRHQPAASERPSQAWVCCT